MNPLVHVRRRRQIVVLQHDAGVLEIVRPVVEVLRQIGSPFADNLEPIDQQAVARAA